MATTPWSNIPSDLLDLIVGRLPAVADTLHLRAVCSAWRDVVPRRPTTTFSNPIKFFSPQSHHCDLLLSKRIVFHLYSPSCSGWLIKIEETRPGIFHLFGPLSRGPTRPVPEPIDLRKIQVRELGHEFVLKTLPSSDSADTGPMGLYSMEYEKVAYLPFGQHCNGNRYVLLCTHNTGKLLMYWSDIEKWKFLDDFTLGYDDRSIFVNDWSLHYVDVVECDSRFYAVTNSGQTVSITVEPGMEPSVSVSLVQKSMIGGDKKRLVGSGEDLFLLDIYTCHDPGLVKVNAFEVFKLDKDEQKWVLVKSIGDRMLFLSDHCSFCAPVGSDFEGFRANCIYFCFKGGDKLECECCSTKLSGENEEEMFKYDEIGVFDLESGTIGNLAKYPDCSKLFWPPPAWIKLQG